MFRRFMIKEHIVFKIIIYTAPLIMQILKYIVFRTHINKWNHVLDAHIEHVNVFTLTENTIGLTEMS